MSGTASDSTSGYAQTFATTHWSVVLAARQGEPFEADAALEKLCRIYWYPLYAFLRREGRNAHDAQDLTQEFFARLLQGKFLANVGPQKGKFRSFLLAALKNFLCDEWDKVRAEKRGGVAELADALDSKSKSLRYGEKHECNGRRSAVRTIRKLVDE